MGAFLPVEALPGLQKYRYASEDRSLLSYYLLKPTYTRLVEFLPRWLAPNMVTLLGLLFSVDSFLRALKYGLKNTEIPQWVYMTHAVELILYQTLDALDGQQARRTGSSSPLGELFDHCVDAINTSLQAYVVASVFQLSPVQLIIMEVSSTANFFVSTWEEYHTQKLFLSVFSGPVEGIIVIAILEIVTGLYGPHIWSVKWGEYSFQEVSLLLAGHGLLFNIASAVANVKKVTKQFSNALLGLLPFVVFWIGFGSWLSVSWVSLDISNFILLFLTIAFTFALLVGRVITAHVTNQTYPMWTPLHCLPFVGTIGHLFLSSYGRSQLLAVLCGMAFGVYATFVAEIISEITTYLDIGCLYIKNKDLKSKSD